jgi:hypothetical protein
MNTSQETIFDVVKRVLPDGTAGDSSGWICLLLATRSVRRDGEHHRALALSIK